MDVVISRSERCIPIKLLYLMNYWDYHGRVRVGGWVRVILYAWNDNSNKYWNYQTLYPVILLGYNVRIGCSNTPSGGVISN